jgi:hypothetical protein
MKPRPEIVKLAKAIAKSILKDVKKPSKGRVTIFYDAVIIPKR